MVLNRILSLRAFVILVLVLCYFSSKGQVSPSEPNFNYTFYVPKDWRVTDTLIQELRMRLVRGPLGSERDHPFVNVLINHMEGRTIDDFATRNERYLTANMGGIQVLRRGIISDSPYKGRWFTYTKEQGGVRREMINYIIPIRGFAYLITCGVSEGAMGRYKAIFDRMAKSFKG